MGLIHSIRKLLWQMGCDIVVFSPATHPLARRRKLLDTYKIDTVIDAGANAGQYATQIRNDLGYRGKIVSFEPLNQAFSLLAKKAEGDPLWEARHYALGDKEEEKEINVAGNSYSSSFLTMLPSHESVAPESKYIGTEKIRITTLDSVFKGICPKRSNVFLKIDTQGYESKVIGGAARSLADIATIQLEMSLVPLYQDELLFGDMFSLLTSLGYSLVSVEPGLVDGSSGRLLQLDGIFHRP